MPLLGPLNVCFVSSSQSISHPGPSQSSHPYRHPASPLVSQTTHSAMLLRASQMFPPQSSSSQERIPQPKTAGSAHLSRGYEQQESSLQKRH
ncbi:hypothetical protein BD309DRAFT_664061 [Dichomitus squalens]|nr:hypothetical protein BD309DRAFT_664061 [Dichomitus squalens]